MIPFLHANNSRRSRLAVIILALAIIPVIVDCAAAEAGKPAAAARPVKLDGAWKISLSDDPACLAPGFDDSKWDTVDLPGTILSYIKQKSGPIEGCLWIRKTVPVDRGLPFEDIGLVMGRIGHADETYFNGTKVGATGKFPPDAFSMWNHPRYYTVPKSIIRFGGPNVIAVRIWYYGFCDVQGEMALAGLEEWGRSKTLANFSLVTLNYLIIAMGVPIFLIFFIIYLRRRSSQEYLFYCLQLLCGIVIVGEVCNFWNMYGSHLTRLKVLAYAWFAINVVHPVFLHRIYNLQRKKTEIILWIALAAAVFVGVLFTTTGRVPVHGLIVIFVLIGVGFYNLSCHVTAIYKKSPYAKLFSLFGAGVVIGAIHDGFTYMFKYIGVNPGCGPLFTIMIFPASAFVLYMGTTLVLVSRIIGMEDEIHDLNTSLESFVIENALLSDKIEEASQNKKPAAVSITTAAEEKIKKVMDYIQKNYTSDISREGLAASIDVHPDNLGKLFRTYTSRKLGDFICELRVRDAARMLVESEDNVINIAFNVGFESLRTFNRIFPKYMGTTPEKYRRQHRGAAPAG
jgi:AraC-like DNA-binding protein